MSKILLVIPLLLWSALLSAQQNFRIILGKVTDETGFGIAGVTVTLKGSSTATLTDMDGEFSLNIPPGDQTLVFASIGLSNKEVVVTKEMSYINVSMESVMNLLSEVVIMEYGAPVSKSMMAGSASIVSNSISKTSDKKTGKTWKRSGLPDNSIRLEVGDNEYLPLKATQIAVKIDGFRVRVLMDCFFYNDKKNGLEGMFKLKLPSGASPYYFAFGETQYLDEQKAGYIPYVNYDQQGFNLSPEAIAKDSTRQWSNIKEARIVAKQKAAKAYEETVANRIDPALMEWAGADLFSCRVFPLTKGKLHRIVIGYDLNMTEALSYREYILALPEVSNNLRVAVDMYNDALLQPEVAPQVDLRQTGDRLRFSLNNPEDKTFSIRYHDTSSLVLYDSLNQYFGASYKISLPEIRQEHVPGSAVFLLDVSLSSNPDKFNVWLKLIEEILTKNKDVIKEFAVLSFNIEHFWWNRNFVKNNYYNVSRFLEYANNLALEGATDLGSGLAEASQPEWLKQNKDKHIFLMSDADYNWGESNQFALQAGLHKGDRIHTYKTGIAGTNVNVLNFLSKVSNGFAFTVTGEEEAELTAKSFRYQPWTIENISIEGVKDFLISGQPSQLYNGQKLIFSGRGAPEGDIHIHLNNGTERRELVLSAKHNIPSDLAERIYGQLALTYLENHGEQTEEATEEYAKNFRVPGMAMSFLMLDNKSDYSRYDINDEDSKSYVNNNTVADLLAILLKNGDGIPLGKGKDGYISWLNRLKNNNAIGFDADSVFMDFVQKLPEKSFNVKLNNNYYRLRQTEQQTEEELILLNKEQLKYDQLLEVANRRKSQKGKADALKLLSSVIEKNPADFIALRDLAQKAMNWNMGEQGYQMMRRIISAREQEALAYLTAARALEKSGYNNLAIIYYQICVKSNWDSDYGSFQEIAALYYRRLLKKIQTQLQSNDPFYYYMTHFRNDTENLLRDKNLLIDEADIVIILNWNTDNTDIDLHVMEPKEEHCYYSHSKTKNGGELSIDVTDGYGPEMYVLRNAVNGKYKAWLSYYADDETKTSSKSKAYVDFYHNWGRKNEKVTRKVILLEKPTEDNRDDNENEDNEYKKDEFEIRKFEVRKSVP